MSREYNKERLLISPKQNHPSSQWESELEINCNNLFGSRKEIDSEENELESFLETIAVRLSWIFNGQFGFVKHQNKSLQCCKTEKYNSYCW